MEKTYNDNDTIVYYNQQAKVDGSNFIWIKVPLKLSDNNMLLVNTSTRNITVEYTINNTYPNKTNINKEFLNKTIKDVTKSNKLKKSINKTLKNRLIKH